MHKKTIILIILYTFILMALFPIIRYLIVCKFGLYTNIKDAFVYERIVISGPVLLFIGVLIMFKYDSLINKLFGLISTIMGVTWIFIIIKTIIEESV